MKELEVVKADKLSAKEENKKVGDAADEEYELIPFGRVNKDQNRKPKVEEEE